MITRSPSENRTSYNREIHHRRSVRLKGYDYSQSGAYFITICTWNKECLFGEIVDGEMRANNYGQAVQEEWLRSVEIRREIMLDEWVIMPNHIHAIVVITDFRRGDRPVARTKDRSSRPTGPKPESLSSLMAGFKSAVTKRINVHRNTPGVPVWHRNYYEHVVRDETEINRIREYIAANPSRWLEDEENPVHFVGATGRSPVP